MIKKILLSILCLSMLITQSFQVLAHDDEYPYTEIEEEYIVKDEELEEAIDEVQEAVILNEDESQRDETSKTFIMSDKSIQKVLYTIPVHYEEEGKWKEIDNTLTEDNSDDINGYSNSKSKLKIKFSKKGHEKNLGSITIDDYSIKWGLEGIDSKSKAVIIKNENQESDKVTKVFNNIYQHIIYEDICENIDLEYVFDSQSIKENIIIKDKTDKNTFTFNYKVNKLKLEDNEQGEIIAKDEETNEVVFIMPKPYMIDAKGVMSDQVIYEIINSKNKQYVIQVSADEEWLNSSERVYPIIIDPVIKVEQKSEGPIETSFVSKWKPNDTQYEQNMVLVGMESSLYGYTRTIVQFDLPAMNKGDMLVDAELGIAMYRHSFYSSSTPDLQINAHLIDHEFEVSEVTWTNQKAYDGLIQDYEFIKDSDKTNQANWKMFDITNATKKRYEDGKSDCSIVIKSWIEQYESTQDLFDYAVNGYFYDNQNTSNQSYFPYVSLTYRNNKGFEPYWDYTTWQTSNGDTIAINNYSGNVVVEHVDAQTYGVLPVTVSHIFNGYQADEEVANIGPKVGKGWKLNIQQTLLLSEKYGLTGEAKDTYPYVYMDEDGTEHYFKLVDGKYLDEDGLGLELTIQMIDEEKNIFESEIKDKSENTMYFNTNGHLCKITDKYDQSIIIEYSDGNITSITDSSGQIITLNIDSSGYLTSIDAPGNKTTVIGYSSVVSDNLDYIQNPGSPKVSFLNAQTLCFAHQIENVGECWLAYDSEMNGFGVNFVREYSAEGNGGQGLKFDRSEYNITKIIACGEDGIIDTIDDVTTVLQFDNYGRLKSKYSTTNEKELGAQSIFMTAGEAKSDNSNIKQLNRISMASDLSPTVNNLLVNHSGESTTNWTKSSSIGSASFSFASTTSEYLFGQKSFKLNVTSCATNGRARIYQDLNTVYVKPNTTYTASAYIKTNNVKKITSSDYGGAVILLYINAPSMPIDENYAAADFVSEYITGTTDEDVNDGWRRVSVTFTTPSDVVYVRFNAMIKEATGTAYFDGLQLEEGDTPSPYNMLENPGFERYTSKLPTSWTGTNTTSEDKVLPDNVRYDDYSLLMKADTSGRKYLKQTVNINGSESDTYIVSGWSYGKGLKDDGVDYKYRLEILIYYTDGSYVWKGAALFNESVENWKHASACFDLSDGTSTNKTPKSIAVYLRSYYSANDIYFDGIQLIKRDVPVYTYDTDGNLISDGTSKYTYNDNDKVLTSTDGIDTTYHYSYNEKGEVEEIIHKVKDGSTTKEKVHEIYSYDQTNGNLVSTAIQNGNDQIKTENVYSESGAFLTETHDEDGNITYYSYSETSGVPRWIFETTSTGDGVATIYEYDDKVRVTQVEKEVSCITLNYDDFDHIIQLNGKTSSYSFAYDEFGNLVTTKTGNVVLSTNNYKNFNGDLESTVLGNDFTYSYKYDEYGNLIELKENGNIVETYKYDKEGILLYTIDHITNIKTKYDYDLDGNIIRIDCYDNTVTGMNDSWLYGLEYGYDTYDRLIKRNTKTKSETISNTVTYSAGSILSAYQIDSSKKVSYTYDGLNRMTQKSINTTTPIKVLYEYADSSRGEEYTTNKISKETIDGKTYEYSYDPLGNIIEITIGNDSIRYAYDRLSRLTREDNSLLNKTYTYTYDSGGNIKLKSEYVYTEEVLSNPIKTIEYKYENTNWKDQLTKYDGQAITYDEIGNPLTYKGYNLVWNGRKLVSMSDSDDIINYTYSSDGYRKTKTVNGVTTTYTYLDGQLLREERPNESLNYIYDNLGNLAKIAYTNGATTTSYYVACNSRGDVEAIYNTSGVLQARYIYDAWGNTKVVDASNNEIQNASHIANINPIRYRGYYYDKETKLYYLLSRYYDSEVGRFISSDDVEYLEPNNVNGLNLYAYCLNNPSNNIDSFGNFPVTLLLITCIVVGAFTGSTLMLSNAYNNGVRDTDLLMNAIEGAFIGASVGLFVGNTGGIIGSGLSGSSSLLAGEVMSSELLCVNAMAEALVFSGSVALTTGGTLSASGLAMFAKGNGPRMGHNQYENKQFNHLCNKYQLTKNQRRILHEYISGNNMTYKEIENAIIELFFK